MRNVNHLPRNLTLFAGPSAALPLQLFKRSKYNVYPQQCRLKSLIPVPPRLSRVSRAESSFALPIASHTAQNDERLAARRWSSTSQQVQGLSYQPPLPPGWFLSFQD